MRSRRKKLDWTKRFVAGDRMTHRGNRRAAIGTTAGVGQKFPPRQANFFS
ncbi:MAG: hypothetical protein IT426_00715 [Pirellulales bacterium]|nr:hypothetical protein [Pirellulales bacterium]